MSKSPHVVGRCTVCGLLVQMHRGLLERHHAGRPESVAKALQSDSPWCDGSGYAPGHQPPRTP